MFKFFVVLVAVATAAQCCEKSSFNDVQLKASRYFRLDDEADDIKIEQPFSGCISPAEEEGLKDAVKIVVNNQKVKVLYSGAVADLKWLHELKLEENGIEEIKPGAFENLPTLVSISLAKNKLKKISEGIFNNMDIKRLLLNDNQISNIAPGAFNDMPNLNRIDLDHNKLQDWNSNWFTNTPKIHMLSATFNQISELPARAFKNFKGKHEETGKSPIVTSIFLSNNNIDDINPKAFQGLKELDYLDLDKNNIKNLDPKVFANFDNIKHLLLNGNKITCLPEDFLSALPTTEIININENPVDCSCLKEMKKWATEHTVNIKMTVRSIECMQERIRNVLDSVKDIN